MVEGGGWSWHDGMMGWWEKSIYIQVRREEGMTSHTPSGQALRTQNSINNDDSSLSSPLSECEALFVVDNNCY